MKKFLWGLVIGILAVVGFTYCHSNEKENGIEKFNISQENFPLENTEMIEATLTKVEDYYYLHGKYEPSELHYLKTKLHIVTDSLVVAEMYVRGKNSFDGGTVSDRLFIYLKRGENTYFNELSDTEMGNLRIRLNICDTNSEKNAIFSRLALKGYMNGETDWESIERTTFKDRKEWKDKNYRKFAIEYTEKELGIKDIK